MSYELGDDEFGYGSRQTWKWQRTRVLLAVWCGMVAGILLPNSVQVGVRWMISGEPEWSSVFWGEHWILRPVVSVLAALGGGFVAGAIARRSGRTVAVLGALPAFLIWAWAAISAWQEELLFMGGSQYFSIGNKLAATVIVVALLPAAAVAGNAGQEIGVQFGQHFDSRPKTLLGVKWYHYIWLPFLIHLILAQISWAGLYAFEWLKMVWRSGPSMSSLIPTAFALALWGTFYILLTGVLKAYRVLAGFDETHSKFGAAKQVLKYGVGAPLLALIMQIGIMFLHAALIRMFQ
jgi:hypothetical protein